MQSSALRQAIQKGLKHQADNDDIRYAKEGHVVASAMKEANEAKILQDTNPELFQRKIDAEAKHKVLKDDAMAAFLDRNPEMLERTVKRELKRESERKRQLQLQLMGSTRSVPGLIDQVAPNGIPVPVPVPDRDVIVHGDHHIMSMDTAFPRDSPARRVDPDALHGEDRTAFDHFLSRWRTSTDAPVLSERYLELLAAEDYLNWRRDHPAADTSGLLPEGAALGIPRMDATFPRGHPAYHFNPNSLSRADREVYDNILEEWRNKPESAHVTDQYTKVSAADQFLRWLSEKNPTHPALAALRSSPTKKGRDPVSGGPEPAAAVAAAHAAAFDAAFRDANEKMAESKEVPKSTLLTLAQHYGIPYTGQLTKKDRTPDLRSASGLFWRGAVLTAVRNETTRRATGKGKGRPKKTNVTAMSLALGSS